MMATTHALAGMVLASVVSLLAPEYAPVALAAGAVGGGFPDLDLYAGHRRTLHFPVYYGVAGAAALTLALATPGAATLGLAAFLLAAALHAGMDALGGGLELRPWEGGSERAVYSHYHGRWLRPRRLVPYDGAPEDALLAGVLGAPLVLTGGEVGTVALALVAVSAGYALVRKRLAELWVAVVRALPGQVARRLPERFAEDGAV